MRAHEKLLTRDAPAPKVAGYQKQDSKCATHRLHDYYFEDTPPRRGSGVFVRADDRPPLRSTGTDADSWNSCPEESANKGLFAQ